MSGETINIDFLVANMPDIASRDEDKEFALRNVIVELFGKQNENDIFGFLINLSNSGFYRENQQTGINIAKKLLQFIYETTSITNERGEFSLLAISLDALLSSTNDLVNISDETKEELVDSMLKNIRELPVETPISKKCELLLSNVYFPIFKLFRLGHEHVDQLVRLWSSPNLVGPDEEFIHTYFTVPNHHDLSNNIGFGVLGYEGRHGKEEVDIALAQLAYKEWENVFSDENNGGMYLKILIDTISKMHTNGLKFAHYFQHFNPHIYDYKQEERVSDNRTLGAENVKGKKVLMRMLNITNSLGIPPQFALLHQEEMAINLSNYNESSPPPPEQILTPKLQIEYLSYLVYSYQSPNALSVLELAKNTFNLISPNVLESQESYSVLYQLVQHLVNIEAGEFLVVLLEHFPKLRVVCDRLDESLSFNAHNLIYISESKSQLLQALFPRAFEAISIYILNTFRESIYKIMSFEQLIKQTDNHDLISSLRNEIRYRKNDLAKILSSLHLLSSEYVNEQLALEFIKSGYGKEWFQIRDKFNLTGGPIRWRNECISAGFMQGAQYFDRESKVHDEMSKYLSVTSSVFGQKFGKIELDAVRQIFEGKTSDNSDLKALGVVSTGDKGISELRNALIKIRIDLGRGNIPSDLSLNNISASYVYRLLNIEGSQYGISDINGFKEKLEHQQKELGDVDRSVPPEYQIDDEYHVQKLEERTGEKFEFSEDFTKAMKVLHGSLYESYSMLHDRSKALVVLEGVNAKIQELISKAEESLRNTRNEKAIQNLEATIRDLNSINISSMTDIISSAPILLKKKEFASVVRAAILMQAVKEGVNLSPLEGMSDLNSEDAVARVVKLQEIILNEVLHVSQVDDLMASKPQLIEQIENLFYTKSIADELEREKADRKKTNEIPMSFVPSRGILMEVSGELADVCWATIQDSETMAKRYPNVVALVPKLRPETENERLVGVVLMIETRSAAGEPVLVLRGLNPQQTFINSIDCESFHNSLLAYASKVAEAKHAKLVLPLTERGGGSTTNRPTYFDYLCQRYINSEIVNLDPDAGSTVNGYDITTICRMVADYSQKAAYIDVA